MTAEMPLALFTTFASVGAGAFVALAVAFFTVAFSDEQLKKIDRLTAIPVAVLLVGFVCAFFHLASPAHVFGVFAGVGSSPLSNELVAGVLFALLAVVYWVVALAGKLPGGARKAFAAVVAVVALVFAWFMGLAYTMPTIASWNTMMVPVQMIGFCLLGGAALGLLVLALAGALGQAGEGSFKAAALVLVGAGLVLGVVGVCAQVMGVSDLSNALTSGADLVAAATLPLGVGVVCLVAAAVCAFLALRGKSATAFAGAAAVLAVVGVLACRLAFYAVQLSVGLYVG